MRTVGKSILTKPMGQSVFPVGVTSQLILKASMGMSHVKSNEILSEEIMLQLIRTVVNESAASFLFGAFLLPEAIIEANFPA